MDRLLNNQRVDDAIAASKERSRIDAEHHQLERLELWHETARVGAGVVSLIFLISALVTFFHQTSREETVQKCLEVHANIVACEELRR